MCRGLTRPSAQWCCRSSFCAPASVRPFSVGTTQRTTVVRLGGATGAEALSAGGAESLTGGAAVSVVVGAGCGSAGAGELAGGGDWVGVGGGGVLEGGGPLGGGSPGGGGGA